MASTPETKKNTWLLDHAKDVHSQCGEDGIIGKALEMLPERDHWCVEFGAWDGRHMSNTCHLIEDHDYNAVFIEGNPAKVEVLKKNFGHNKKVHPMCRFVGWEGDQKLDNILAETAIPKNFDFLSIDIDGNDWHVWKAVDEYRPKLVIVEFNPTMSNELDYVQPPEFSTQIGCSLKALEKLGKEKGYELICVTAWNGIFVDAKYYDAFGITDNRCETLRLETDKVTHMFSGYDGRIRMTGYQKLPWVNMPILEKCVQVIPRFLQNYPDQMGPIRRNMLGLCRAIAKWRR